MQAVDVDRPPRHGVDVMKATTSGAIMMAAAEKQDDVVEEP